MEIELKPRKIIGWNYTNYVAIPPVWLRARKLQRKSYVKLSIDVEGNLVLKPAQQQDEQ